MEQKLVQKLEREIEGAIAEVIAGMESRRLPIAPSPSTIHLMSKAAVTVYEAAVENWDSQE